MSSHTGPGRPSRREVQGLLQVVADRRRVGHHDGVFRDRGDEPGDVELLVAELAQREVRAAHGRLELDLSGNDDHSERLDPRAEHARDRVRAARAGRDVHRGKAVGQAIVTGGGHRAGLLMVAADVREFLAAPDRVVQVHGAAAGDHEDVPDAAGSKRLRDVVGDANHRSVRVAISGIDFLRSHS